MSLWRTVGASRWWYRFPETSEHNLSLSSSCLKERNLQLRHTEVCFLKVLDRQHSDTCWSNICIELFSLLSSFMFCSIKVISCKLNTSLWSYWLNEAQLKTAGWRDGRISFSIPPKMFWIWIYFYKLQQTLVWLRCYKSFSTVSFVIHWRWIRCNLSESNRPHPV